MAIRMIVIPLILPTVCALTGCGCRPTEPQPAPTVDTAALVQAERARTMRNPHVNRAHFDAIRKGMALEEVIELLGQFSGSTVITEKTPTEGQWFLWEDETEGQQFRKVIRIRFVAGRVEEKVSEGLSGADHGPKHTPLP